MTAVINRNTRTLLIHAAGQGEEGWTAALHTVTQGSRLPRPALGLAGASEVAASAAQLAGKERTSHISFTGQA